MVGTVLSSVRVLLATVLAILAPSAWASCSDTGIAIQVLGSGGPFGVGRASSGYLVWIDGVSRIMVDAGGGTFAHFHESGAQLADIQLLALSHFHPDHSTEVPALLWPQNGNLRVAGPSGNAGFPSLNQFLEGLFGVDGVFRIINGRFEFDTVTVDVASENPLEVLAQGQARVTALGVPHGQVPAVAYRVDIGEVSFAFSSDQNGLNPAFTEFVRDVDVLVVHFAGREDAEGLVAELHAKPSVWGQIASDANVGNLVLSHLTSTQDLDESLEHLSSTYNGPLVMAEDFLCIAVD